MKSCEILKLKTPPKVNIEKVTDQHMHCPHVRQKAAARQDPPTVGDHRCTATPAALTRVASPDPDSSYATGWFTGSLKNGQFIRFLPARLHGGSLK